MNDKKEVKPVFVLPCGEEKLYLTPEFTKKDGKHKTVMILKRIEEKEKCAIPKEYMYDEEWVAMCAMDFKSKKSITNIIRFLRIFRDEVFGKTNKELQDEQRKSEKDISK